VRLFTCLALSTKRQRISQTGEESSSAAVAVLFFVFGVDVAVIDGQFVYLQAEEEWARTELVTIILCVESGVYWREAWKCN
jgi:hypothetical protein